MNTGPALTYDYYNNDQDGNYGFGYNYNYNYPTQTQTVTSQRKPPAKPLARSTPFAVVLLVLFFVLCGSLVFLIWKILE